MTTPTQRTFRDYGDFTNRGQVGDTFRDAAVSREITDWTITAITESSLSPRLVHLSGIATRHEGSPVYAYETRRVTQRADGTAGPAFRSVIISATDQRVLLARQPAKRFSAAGLSRAHAEHVG